MSCYCIYKIILYCSLIGISTVVHCYHILNRFEKQNFLKVNSYASNNNQITTNGSNTRRVKVNKYSKFSKKEMDPLLVAIDKSNQESRNSKIDYSLPIRGTTVPTILASNNITTAVEHKPRVSFKHISSIVPSDPLSFGYIEIGSILGAHGVKGEIKVQVESDFTEKHFKPDSTIFIRKPNRRSPRAIQVQNARKQSDNTYLIQLKHITTRLGAMAFHKYNVYVREQDRPALQQNEYLIRDVVGMNCYLYKDYNDRNIITGKNTLDSLSSISPIAIVKGVVPPDELCESITLSHLMHAQLELELLDRDMLPGNNHSKTSSSIRQLCLVPLVPDIVPVIDIVNKRIFLSPPVGLLDITYTDQPKRVVIRGYLPHIIERLSSKDREYLNANYFLE